MKKNIYLLILSHGFVFCSQTSELIVSAHAMQSSEPNSLTDSVHFEYLSVDTCKDLGLSVLDGLCMK